MEFLKHYKTVLIIGSRGFVGLALSDFLSSRNYRVKEFKGDIRNIEDEKQFEDCDFVIHLASKSDKNDSSLFETNLIGTFNIIHACRKYNCKLIYLSSTQATIKKNKYGISKALAEQLIEEYTRHGLRAVTVRSCALYNSSGKDFLGNTAPIHDGEWYPLSKLNELIEKILRKDTFYRYKVYKTRSVAHIRAFITRYITILKRLYG